MIKAGTHIYGFSKGDFQIIERIVNITNPKKPKFHFRAFSDGDLLITYTKRAIIIKILAE